MQLLVEYLNLLLPLRGVPHSATVDALGVTHVVLRVFPLLNATGRCWPSTTVSLKACPECGGVAATRLTPYRIMSAFAEAKRSAVDGEFGD